MIELIGSIIVALLLFFIGQRQRIKDRISLVYFETEKINLNSSILKNLNEVVLSYQGKEISRNIFLFKGFLLNNGRYDLRKNDIENNLHAKLKDGRWLNCNVVPSNEKMNVYFTIDYSNIFFTSDLFKVNEYIYFEAVAETDEKDILFEHRIANLGKIQSIKPGRIEKRILKQSIWFLIVAFIVFLLTSILIDTYKSRSLFRIEYKISIEKSFRISHEHLPNKDTVVKIVEPLPKTIYYMLNSSDDMDAIGEYIHKEYNVFNLMLHSPDTVIEVQTEPLSDMKVSLKQETIKELRDMLISLTICMVVLFLLFFDLKKSVKHYLLKIRVERILPPTSHKNEQR